jgi:hypothetical protein
MTATRKSRYSRRAFVTIDKKYRLHITTRMTMKWTSRARRSDVSQDARTYNIHESVVLFICDGLIDFWSKQVVRHTCCTWHWRMFSQWQCKFKFIPVQSFSIGRFHSCGKICPVQLSGVVRGLWFWLLNVGNQITPTEIIWEQLGRKRHDNYQIMTQIWSKREFME